MATQQPADFDFDAAADEAVKRGTSSLSEAVKAGARDGVIAAFRHLGLAALVKGDHAEPDGDEGRGGEGDGDGDEGAPTDAGGDDGGVGGADDGASGGGGGSDDGGDGGSDNPENDPANAAGADDMLYKGEIDVTKLIAELAGVPGELRKLGTRLDALEKGMATKGEIQAVRVQVSELAKGTAAGVQQILVAQGDTTTRLVEQPGRVHQPRVNTNTAAQRAGESVDGKLTDIELAKALAQEVITPVLKRTYAQHGKFCEDEAQNAEMEAKVRTAAANYGKRP